MKGVKYFILTLMLVLSSLPFFAQQLLVEGEAHIEGPLVITNGPADSSIYIGAEAGPPILNSNRNTFLGRNTGNFTFGPFNAQGIFASENTFIGAFAGQNNNFGYRNTYLGSKSGPLWRDSLVNAIAIGYNAKVNCNNCAAIGDKVKVGIGTEHPITELDIQDVDASGSASINLSGGEANLNLFISENDAVLKTTTNHEIEFGVNNSSVLFLTTDRRVGIGTGIPESDLHISSVATNALIGNAGCTSGTFAGVGFGTSLDCTNYSLLGNGTSTYVNAPANGNVGLRINNQNAISISSARVVKLHQLGTAGINQLCTNGNGEISPCSSSRRFKQNIQPFIATAEMIAGLSPVSYIWRQDGSEDIGLIAEEVAEVDHRLVTKNAAGEIEGVKYDRIAVLLLDLVKCQETRISELEQKISDLEQRTESEYLKVNYRVKK